MLVLTRRENDEVVLSDDSGRELGRVIIARVGSSGRVRLGFEFGPEITITRAELLDQAEVPA